MIYFFNMVHFSKYIYITIIEQHATSAHQMHHIALKNSAIVEMLTFGSSYMKQIRVCNLDWESHSRYMAVVSSSSSFSFFFQAARWCRSNYSRIHRAWISADICA